MKTFDRFYSKNQTLIVILSIIFLLVFLIVPIATIKHVDRNKEYISREDVALYLMEYHELPSNYITKDGYEYAKRHGINMDSMVIGGDTYWTQGELEDAGIMAGTCMKEADIVNEFYSLTNRDQYRVVYTTNSDEVRVFFTYDHYKTFNEITRFELQLMSNIWWIIFGVYLLIEVIFYSLVVVAKIKSHKVDATRRKA